VCCNKKLKFDDFLFKFEQGVNRMHFYEFFLNFGALESVKLAEIRIFNFKN
jgi:hypothetical protein